MRVLLRITKPASSHNASHLCAAITTRGYRFVFNASVQTNKFTEFLLLFAPIRLSKFLKNIPTPKRQSGSRQNRAKQKVESIEVPDFQAPSHFLLSICVGGARRDRTADPLLAKQVLSQLSYSPRYSIIWWVWVDLNHRPHPYQGCALTN